MQSEDSVLYKVSKDETLILSEINRILNEKDWTGDLGKIVSERAQNIQLLKQVLIFTQNYLKFN